MKLADMFNQPRLYSLVQKSLKTQKYEGNLSKYIGDNSGVRVLDFGCGPGDLYPRFKNSVYLGIDPLESCINSAISRFGPNNSERRFIQGDHEKLAELKGNSYTLIIAIGVMHHMPDKYAKDFVAEARRLLIPNAGKLITLDPVRHPEESFLSGFLVSQDRGRFVRSPEGYESIVKQNMNLIESKVLKRLIRIPYDQFITVSC
jgi:SAM-dependent methyltransferase